MNRTVRTALSGACALALAALLATPGTAAERPRQGTPGGHDRTIRQRGSSSSSHSATTRSAQPAERGRSARPVQVERSAGGSRSVRAPAPAPRSVQPRQPDNRGVSAQRSWSRPESGSRRPAELDRSQRGASPLRSELRGRADRDASLLRSTPSRPTTRQPELRSRGRVDEARQRDDRGGWRDTSRSQRPSDSGRVSDRVADRSAGRGSGRTTRQTTDTYDGGSRHQEQRYDTRSGSHDGGSFAERYDSSYSGRRTQQFDGRVQRLERGDGGYRVWLDTGSDHCFWIPDARYLLWPLRVGITVSFGGFWNPAGYYNVYDYGPTFRPYYGSPYYGSPYYGGSYYGGSYYGSSYYGGGYGGGGYDATSLLRGYVDRFDDVAGTMVIHDDRSGRYATVLIRRGDRQFDYLQPGDWVTLSGVWTRDGYFEAYRIEDLAQR